MRGRLSRSNALVFMLSLMLMMNIVQAPSLMDVQSFDNEVNVEMMQDRRMKAYTPHSPISIDGDIDFNDTAFAEGWSGNGSAEDPFIIEGLEIDSGGSATHCISIINTRVNFTIRNCNITNAYTSPGCGIFLDNVMFGRVESNIVYSSHFNIYLTNAHYMVVKNNTCWDAAYSISLRTSSSYNIVTDNNNSDNRGRAFNLESGSHHNTVINNTANDNVNFGIVLYLVTYNTVVNNTFIGNTDQLVHSNNADYNFLLDNTCNSNGHGIYLFAGSQYNQISNNTCRSNTYHGIYVSGSANNDLYNNTCHSNLDHGILASSSPYTELINNTCTSNLDYGINLFHSDYSNGTNNVCNLNRRGIDLHYTDNSIISNNTCNFNDFGILLDYSIVDTISNNTCVNNYQSGIGLYGNTANNVVEWNVFIDNSIGGYDIGSTNAVDYNYWSDYEGFDADQNGIGDTPHPLVGSVNEDPHPLMLQPGIPIGWGQLPKDQILTYENTFRYDLNASSFNGIDQWWLNDSINFDIDQFGIITNATILPKDVIGVEVFVNDSQNNVITAQFVVYVVDVIAPTWIEIPTDQSVMNDVSFRYDLNATDPDGLDLWWINDTVRFSIDQDGIITNATFLEIGIYGLEVFVNDSYGNVLTNTFFIAVSDTMAPIWIQEPVDQIIEYGLSFYYDLNATDPEGIDYWWINDTIRFNIDQDGVIINATVLSPEIIPVQINVNDTNGNVLTVVLNVTVVDLPPVWLEVPTDQISVYGTEFYYDLNATDPVGLHIWWINDTVRFNIDQDGRITNATSLPLGIFVLHIFVNDTTGTILSSIFVVNVVFHKPHDPIIINSDQEFADTALLRGWTGEGSFESPYIITRLEIDRGSDNGHCISISHTRVYFVIIDCILIGGSTSPGSGIYLYNVTKGRIVNNTCIDNYNGIYLLNSSFITISDNFCSSSLYNGIYLFSNCANNTLMNNICTGKIYGIYVYSSCSYNLLANNTCTNNNRGIYLRNANLNTLIQNNCSYNSDRGISIESSSFNDVLRNDCSHNNNQGCYLIGADYNTVLYNDFSFCTNGIRFESSDYNSLRDNICNTSNYGIYLYQSHYNMLINNTCSFSPYSAIYVYYSTYNTIVNSTFSYGNYGIYVNYRSQFNTITNNTSSYNSYGIYIFYECFSNNINWNTFVDNAINGYIYETDGFFDSNYWSDYTGEDLDGDNIGDTPHTLGPYSYQDMHPLMLNPKAPPFWLVPPEDQVIEYKEIYTYDLNAMSFLDVTWWINNSEYFDISDEGVLAKIATIPLGSYDLLVQVTDEFGQVLSGVFTITVEDWSCPSWLELPVGQMLQCGDILHYNLNASDVSNLDKWWINDTLHFSIDNEGIITSNGFIPVGGYGIHVFVNDTLGYVLSYGFTVTIIDTIAPSWVIEPENQISEYGSPFVYDLSATDLSGIGEWSIDDEFRFSIDSTGRITANLILQPSEYYLIIYVSDIYGNVNGSMIIIEVVDTTPPEWTTELTDQYIDHGAYFEYHISATDLSGIDYWQINDTLTFQISGTGWISSRDILEPGEYGLLVTVYDSYGNSISATFTVFVIGLTSTTTTETTTTTTEVTTTSTTTTTVTEETTTTTTTSTTVTTSTTPQPPPGPDTMIVLVLGMGLGIGVTIVIVIIVLRKRGGSAG